MQSHLVCFILLFGGSGQSYLRAILLHSLSDTHFSSAEEGILLLSLGIVKNNKWYLRIGVAFYASCKLHTQKMSISCANAPPILLTSGKQQMGK